MDLNDMLVFTKVVQERLGARLLQRTTRKLNLTEVGQHRCLYDAIPPLGVG